MKGPYTGPSSGTLVESNAADQTVHEADSVEGKTLKEMKPMLTLQSPNKIIQK